MASRNYKKMASSVLRDTIEFWPITDEDRSNAGKALNGRHGPAAMHPLAGRILRHWKQVRDNNEPIPACVSLAAQVLRERA